MATVDFTTFKNVIGDKLVGTEKTRNGVNPATLEELPPVPVSTVEDIDAAVAEAKKCFRGWANTPLKERQEAVLRFADALEKNAPAFSKMLTLEQGKTVAGADMELAQSVGTLRGMAGLPFPEDTVQDVPERKVVTRYVPVGISVGIVPWNFPILLACFKLAPALIAASPIILKPSPFTPYCGLKLAELASKFFPPGAVQALSGDDSLGPAFTLHPGIDKVSFTGSVATGMRVMQSCAKTLKRVTLELGGNDAAIVCKDVDIPTTAASVAQLALYNSGQVCVAIKRVYVHKDIYDEFLAEVVRVVESLKVGNGLEDGIALGPVQNSMQYERIQCLLKTLKQENIKVAAGSIDQEPSNKGYHISPVVIANPSDDSKIVTEEQFGPVFPVMQWSDEEEVIERANNTEVGLGASVWTRNQEQADRIATQLQAGNVWINTHLELQPDAAFGGHKFSGIGSELGVGGLKSYCNMQTIYHNKAVYKL